jgi:hypothetical protein
MFGPCQAKIAHPLYFPPRKRGGSGRGSKYAINPRKINFGVNHVLDRSCVELRGGKYHFFFARQLFLDAVDDDIHVLGLVDEV